MNINFIPKTMRLPDRMLKSGILKAIFHYSRNKKITNEILNSRGNMDSSFPSDFSASEKEDIALVKPYTMTSMERLVSLSRAVEHIVSHRVEGDIVECGVWKGGSMMLVAKTLIRLRAVDKKLFLFDTFEGMSDPGSEDVSTVNQQTARDLLNKSDKMQGNNVWCYSTLDEVKQNLAKTNYPSQNTFYFKGKVEDTLPEPSLGKISLLRLDTDWYESTRHELETLYDRLVTGGVLIIDDYGHWSGSRKAVDEFIAARKLKLFFNRMDYTGRLAIKTQSS